MTQIPRATSSLQLLALQARAEARAILWQYGFYDDFETAIGPLFQDALASGLVDGLSEAAVKAIIEAPFVLRQGELSDG